LSLNEFIEGRATQADHWARQPIECDAASEVAIFYPVGRRKPHKRSDKLKTWSSGWQRTHLPGVYVCGDAVRIRVRVVDPHSGRMREINRILNHVAPGDASEHRKVLQEELRRRLHDPPKQNVIEFGRYWLGVKRAVVDAGTYARYDDALKNHVFARLGRFDFRFPSRPNKENGIRVGDAADHPSSPSGVRSEKASSLNTAPKTRF
jgi:hypothetical protein